MKISRQDLRAVKKIFRLYGIRIKLSRSDYLFSRQFVKKAQKDTWAKKKEFNINLCFSSK